MAGRIFKKPPRKKPLRRTFHNKKSVTSDSRKLKAKSVNQTKVCA